MFDALKQDLKRALRIFGPVFKAAGHRTPSRKDMFLDADEYQVKHKLGASFFTRKLSRNARAARLASLTSAEWSLAKNRGWI